MRDIRNKMEDRRMKGEHNAILYKLFICNNSLMFFKNSRQQLHYETFQTLPEIKGVAISPTS